MFKLTVILTAIVAFSGTLVLSVPTPGQITSTIHTTTFYNQMICKLATRAEHKSVALRQKLAIYQHFHELEYPADLKRRSSSRNWACTQALVKAEWHTPVFVKALRELLIATELLAELRKSRCDVHVGGHDKEARTTDVDSALKRFINASQRYKWEAAMLELLVQNYETSCEQSAQEEFDEGAHDEL